MDHPHIERLLLFMMAVTVTLVHSMKLFHANKNSHEYLRLTQSATSNRRLDLTRESSVNNCYESTCVLNEQFCSESKQGCDMCRYDHGECTTNWDCFEFCSDKKAEEICGGTGSTETTGFPWWSYLILVIFIVSIIINIWFGIKRLRIWKNHSSNKRRNSDFEESDKDASSKMLSNSQETKPQISNPSPLTTLSKKPSAPPYPDNSTTQVQTHETENKPKSDNEESGKISKMLSNSQEIRPQISNPSPQTTLSKEPSALPDTDNSTTQVQTHKTEKKPKSYNEELEKVATLPNLDHASAGAYVEQYPKIEDVGGPDTVIIGQTIPLKKEISGIINENAA